MIGKITVEDSKIEKDSMVEESADSQPGMLVPTGNVTLRFVSISVMADFWICKLFIQNPLSKIIFVTFEIFSILVLIGISICAEIDDMSGELLDHCELYDMYPVVIEIFSFPSESWIELIILFTFSTRSFLSVFKSDGFVAMFMVSLVLSFGMDAELSPDTLTVVGPDVETIFSEISSSVNWENEVSVIDYNANTIDTLAIMMNFLSNMFVWQSIVHMLIKFTLNSISLMFCF